MKGTASLTGGLQGREVGPLVHRSPSPLSSKPKPLPYTGTSLSPLLKNPPLIVLEIDDLVELFFTEVTHCFSAERGQTDKEEPGHRARSS